MKKALIIAGIVVGVLILIVVALPLFINVNTFKPTLESDLSGALGRKVAIGNIQLSILSGGVTVDNVSIADDPAFSTSPFLTAKKLTAGVNLFPLIFSKKLEVRSFTISDPQVTLLRSPSGTWNFSSLGSTNSTKPAASPAPTAATSGTSSSSAASSSAPNASVGSLKLVNGTLVVGTAGAHGKTETYSGVNFQASDLSRVSQFPFKLTANTPGGGTISLEGNAGPLASGDMSLTPFTAKLNAEHIDLASTGFVDSSSGLAGVVSFTGTFSSDGTLMSSQGTVKTERIRLVAGGSPSTVPVNIDYTTTYTPKSQAGKLSLGEVHIGDAVAHLTGTFDTSAAATTVQMKLNGQSMPVTDLQDVLPAAGITLPTGASLRSGSLNIDLALFGPIDKLVITGPVKLSNGTLAGFDLKSKLGALGSFAGLGGGGSSGTEIQTLSADLRQDPSGTQAKNLLLVLPSIGTLTGDANISSTGHLDCKMVAKLGGHGAAGAMGTTLSSLGGGGKSQGGIPFKIEGTTSNPVFVPEVGAMAGSMLKGVTGVGGKTNPANQVQGVIGGLFGKKKK
ncbi:MAG TPA: AsmA family protein [Candidatus Dormibacteraeota bacterium]|nr:AsmA family protein [Candidatus Dormibacteraeota bacterium]